MFAVDGSIYGFFMPNQFLIFFIKFEELMSQKTNQISCPNCGSSVDVKEILYHQVQEEVQKEFSSKFNKRQKEYQNKVEALQKEKELIDNEKAVLDETISQNVKEKLKTESRKLEKQLEAKLRDEKDEELQSLNKEIKEKSDKLREFSKAKAEIEKLKREKDSLRNEIELESEKKINEELRKETSKIRKAEQEKNEIKLTEQKTVIEQLTHQLKEAQRKAEQGSIQLQGEAQELAIEEYLSVTYPLDEISEIKKGARGADCLQTVNTHSKQNCGAIYYESKRTKDFQKSWIEKLKTDLQAKNADIGVLVTEAMPKEMETLGEIDGIWICTFTDFKGLSLVLRESLIRISSAVSAQENRGDKMSMLYDFLTGNEFRMQIEAIVEGFSQMHEDLEKEKRSMQGIWKKREKQIQKVLLNTTNMYSSIKGIAGKSIQTVQALELPDS
jgi:hypothetical protein